MELRDKIAQPSETLQCQVASLGEGWRRRVVGGVREVQEQVLDLHRAGYAEFVANSNYQLSSMDCGKLHHKFQS